MIEVFILAISFHRNTARDTPHHHHHHSVLLVIPSLPGMRGQVRDGHAHYNLYQMCVGFHWNLYACTTHTTRTQKCSTTTLVWGFTRLPPIMFFTETASLFGEVSVVAFWSLIAKQVSSCWYLWNLTVSVPSLPAWRLDYLLCTTSLLI